MPKTKMIKIPVGAHGEIFMLAQRAKWSKDHIADCCSRTMVACERIRREADANLWAAIRRAAPSSSELTNPVYDADAGVVLERDENGKNTGKAVEVDRSYMGEIGLALEECDCAMGAKKHVAQMAMDMEEIASRNAERLRLAIVRHIPETADGGNWQIDDRRMVVIRMPDDDSNSNDTAVAEDTCDTRS